MEPISKNKTYFEKLLRNVIFVLVSKLYVRSLSAKFCLCVGNVTKVKILAFQEASNFSSSVYQLILACVVYVILCCFSNEHKLFCSDVHCSVVSLVNHNILRNLLKYKRLMKTQERYMKTLFFETYRVNNGLVHKNHTLNSCLIPHRVPIELLRTKNIHSLHKDCISNFHVYLTLETNFSSCFCTFQNYTNNSVLWNCLRKLN